MSRYISFRDFDWLLLTFVLVICGLGVMEIHSATLHTKFQGAHIRQIYWILGGVAGMFLVSLINYQKLLDRVHFVRGNHSAKYALESTVVHLLAAAKGESTSHFLGGTRSVVECGLSVGIRPSLDDLLDFVSAGLATGFRRIKLKIRPGWDVEPTRVVRAAIIISRSGQRAGLPRPSRQVRCAGSNQRPSGRTRSVAPCGRAQRWHRPPARTNRTSALIARQSAG